MLTAVQQETLDYIVGQIGEHGRPPTVREIAAHFGISVHAVACRLELMEKKGAIAFGWPSDSRNIRIPGVRWQMISLPTAAQGER